MPSGATIRVEGLAELRRGFKKMDASLGDEYRDRMKSIAGVVADEAKAIAERKGLRDTGRLIKGIKPGMRGATALVRSNAKRAGYRYPAVYEFGYGRRRAFMVPALEAKQGEVMEALGDMLDDVFERGGFRRGME